ncbi:MAG: BtaA family protein [Candidatus Fibromonas sp.]|jgi:S-adenosylmethionine-diacylglycerol 3-amino-3-carboxypropyl transferase|nr:BtaA family protein [Candidatus Fibromonas sp.]
MTNSSAIQNRASFDAIRYANVWEDASLLLEALAPLRGKRMVSICSSGDNALALLTLNPCELLAVDLNPAQIACLDIRCAAIRDLEREEVLAFLGFEGEPDCREKIYALLRSGLPRPSREFWDVHIPDIKRGVIHAGKFEHYFKIFRKWILPLIHGKSKRKKLISFEQAHAQALFYDSAWNNWRWRLLFRLFFSRAVMGVMGRDPEFFRFVEGSVAERILKRAEFALRNIPGAENPWLQYIVSGNFAPALPPYLESKNFAVVKANLAALQAYHGTIDKLAASPAAVTGYNLSDIFEYMDESLFRAVCGSLLGSAASSSRLVYWNMLVPRSVALCIPERVQAQTKLAQSLFCRDRAFFYSAFHVDEVL